MPPNNTAGPTIGASTGLFIAGATSVSTPWAMALTIWVKAYEMGPDVAAARGVAVAIGVVVDVVV